MSYESTNRVQASVLAAVVMVLSVVGWAAAQQVNSSTALKDVRGSGTAGTVPLWTGKDTLGNSSITQSSNGDQTINGSLGVTGSLFLPNTTDPNTGVISIGGVPVLYTPPFSCPPLSLCRRNTFVGPSSGNFTTTGFSNTATGDEALDSITTGSENTATGAFALRSNTTGQRNTATGTDALSNNTTGFSNTAMGVLALAGNTTGVNNTATGESALFRNTTGNLNTATGFGALGQNTTGSANTAIGFAAGNNIITGSDNIAIGVSSGGNIITGSNNIDIGNDVQGVIGESNTIRIGNTTPPFPIPNRTFIAGIFGVTTGLTGAPVVVDANGQLGTMSSSRRFKDDIQDMGDESSDLMKLRPVTFRYKQALEDGSHPVQYGLVAEEVAEVNPGLVQFDKDGQPQTVLYHVLPSLLLNEAQKQHQHIDAQEKVIQSQQEQIQSQQQQIQAQQEQLKAQEERLRKLEAILSSKTD